MPVLTGTALADQLHGTYAAADTFFGGGGGDTLDDAGDGNVIYGDLYADAPQDRADGGNDTIVASGGHNQVYAGSGNDSVSVGGYSTLYGGLGDDSLAAYSYSQVYAGDGNDRVDAIGYCTVNGADGDDRLTVTFGAPMFAGDAGALVIGGRGRDFIDTDGTIYTDEKGSNAPAEGGDRIFLSTRALDLGRSNLCTVQDFKPGVGGDVLLLERPLAKLAPWGYDGTNPLLDRARLASDGTRVVQSGDGVLGGNSWMRLLEDANGVQVQLDADGSGAYVTVAMLSGVRLAKLAAANFDPPLALDGAAAKGAGGSTSDEADGVFLFEGNDTVSAGGGNDVVYTMRGNDCIDGGAGNDELHGGADNDSLFGGLGDDRLYGDGGLDLLSGGDGNDVLQGDGSDTLRGDDGDDQLWLLDTPSYDASGRAALLDGGAGADVLSIYSGGGGHSTLLGGVGNDALSVSMGAGIEGPGAGGLRVDGGGGHDSIVVYGGDAATILGGAGNDTIQAYGSGMVIDAGAGNDQIQILPGYISSGRISTGAGADVVVLQGYANPMSPAAPVVTDFKAGAHGDRLDLSRLYGWTDLRPGEDPFAAGVLRLTASAGGTCIELDADGSANGLKFQTLLVLQGVAPKALTAANFVQTVHPLIGGNAALPRAQADKTIVLAEDAAPVALKLSAPVDPDGGTPAITVISTPAGGQMQLDGRAVLNYWDDRSLTASELTRLQFKPNADASGSLGVFTYQVTDDEGSTVTRSVRFEATPADDAPTLPFLPGSYTLADTSSERFTLDLDNVAHDADGPGALQFSFTTNGQAGLPDWLAYDAATHVLSGSLPYQGAASATIGVTVTDATGLQGTGSFTLQRAEDGHTLWGTYGADTLLGGSAGDQLWASGGNDWLNGRAGNDALYGHDGNDTLVGGNGQDSLEGGEGQDHFRFAGTGTSTVQDFDPAQDVLEFDRAAFPALGAPGALDPAAFVQGRAAQDGGDRLLYDRASGELFYDADGTGASQAVLVARLTPGTALSAAELFVL